MPAKRTKLQVKATNRDRLRRGLALAWIRKNRRDVAAVIEAEVDKKFPKEREAKLPKSLDNLK
jgi:hypothetical protein